MEEELFVPDYTWEESPTAEDAMPPLELTLTSGGKAANESDKRQAQVEPASVLSSKPDTPDEFKGMPDLELAPTHNPGALDDLPVLEPSPVPPSSPPISAVAHIAPVRPHRKRPKSKQTCPQPGCEHATKQLKRHVIRQHICDRWCFLYPLLACWECRKLEIASHVRSHGAFGITNHLPELSFLVAGFVTYLCDIIGAKSPGDLLTLVRQRELGDAFSSFKEEEQAVWDAYDAFVGLPPMADRDLVTPTRISSIFHWRTLQRLLTHSSPATEHGGSFVDSHCHVDRLLHRARYTGTLSQYMNSRQEEIGVDGFLGCIANFCDPESYCDPRLWLRLISDHAVYAAVGLHPKKARDFSPDTEQVIRHLLDHPKCCALGEIGLDYSGCHGRNREVQKTVLRNLLAVAIEYKKPVVIHCRDADADCFAILSECLPQYWNIHLHCFTQGWQEASKWCSTFPNLYVGLTPIITWGTPGPRSVAQNIPLERLLLETDSPYFVPSDLAKTTTFSIPTMAKVVAQEVARVKGLEVEEVLTQCIKNTRNMYPVNL
ncbi:putative deoxyribonuclease TATDN2 [Patiria miniata]|uniref:Uncharacterized protein n=1 Tax=Patiria miniata TaxID=46514 RepID=A0A913ZHN0_PATMI|nr:putative deoxyribonuclease TATDN2 [Patiria miniata]